MTEQYIFYRVVEVASDPTKYCVIFVDSGGDRFFPLFVQAAYGEALQAFHLDLHEEPIVVLHDFLVSSWEQLTSRVVCLSMHHDSNLEVMRAYVTLLSIDSAGGRRYVMMDIPLVTAAIVATKRDLPFHVSASVLGHVDTYAFSALDDYVSGL